MHDINCTYEDLLEYIENFYSLWNLSEELALTSLQQLKQKIDANMLK